MKKAYFAVLIVLCLLLSGCSDWMDGSYSAVYPYTERGQQNNDQIVSVTTYTQLREALADLVERSGESMLLNVAQMNQERISVDMQRAISYVLESTPIGAYAVEQISYEQGTRGGQDVLFVTAEYNHSRPEILRMKRAQSMDDAKEIICDALELCEARVILIAETYRNTDIPQLVKDYADEHPDIIMEVPQVTVNMYPEKGTARVLEVIFSYQTNRENLRSMQSRVRPLFTSAELYVSGNHADEEKYAQLYAFLMERHEYTLETSITSSYSLLVHGVGDSKAFATVYAAMCRRAGLKCMVVSGTSEGESLFWNMIQIGDRYAHVDLLRCSREEYFHVRTDEEMSGYVWDYSAYPACKPPESLEPSELRE